MPLILAPLGEEMKIVRIVADDKTRKHLSNLGILEQQSITVISHSGESAVCKVLDARLALDKELAAHIFVA